MNFNFEISRFDCNYLKPEQIVHSTDDQVDSCVVTSLGA